MEDKFVYLTITPRNVATFAFMLGVTFFVAYAGVKLAQKFAPKAERPRSII